MHEPLKNMAATYFGMHKKIPFPGLALDSGLCQPREQAFLFFWVPNYGGQHCVAFEVLLNRVVCMVMVFQSTKEHRNIE